MERKGSRHPLHALHPNVTELSARPTDDLDWEWIQGEKQLFCFDFGEAKSSSEALFAAHLLALREFTIKIPTDDVAGVCFYSGPFFPTNLEEAELFSDYLHRLAAELPFEIPIYCHFILRGDIEPALLAQQLSMRRFEHFELILEGHPLVGALRPSNASVGLVLPQDTLLASHKIRTEWNRLVLEMKTSFRILPEELINEQWDGIDELIVLASGLTDLGERMLKGFEATGGAIKRKSE